MKKLIYLFVMLMLVSGCATVSQVTPKLSLGMTKEEVIAKCGNPTQSGALKDKDGKVLESFMYRETLYQGALGQGGYASPITTYVYFEDGKVVYYGNPNPTSEPSRSSGQSNDDSHLIQQQIDLQRQQVDLQRQQNMQQQMDRAWDSASQATRDAIERNKI